jgi:protease-4
MKLFIQKIITYIKNNLYVRSVLTIIAAIITVVILILALDYLLPDESDSSWYSNDKSCNVAGIEIRGDIYTYLPLDSEGYKLYGNEDTVTSEDILYYIGHAKYDDDIKAILIEVDSYGGSPVAAEEIANAIKNVQKPVVAFIREAGVSAAYYAITSADYIFATRNSDVGSIGITQSYLENSSFNQNEGYSFIQLSIGKFKDSGNPDKPTTEEDRELFMRDLNIIYQNFIETVSVNRNIPIERVRAIADGSTVLGAQAKELGLIDEVGGYADAQRYLEDVLGEDVDVCW